MSELLVLGLKLLFLALLWLFILFALNVVRTDLFGRKVVADPAPETTPAPAATPRPRRNKRAAARAPTHLKVTAGPQTGLVLALQPVFLIGRTHDSALVLDDQFMSARHAVITSTPQGYVIEDLGSTNGTFVNEQRLTAPRLLSRTDTLRIGRTVMSLDA